MIQPYKDPTVHIWCIWALHTYQYLKSYSYHFTLTTHVIHKFFVTYSTYISCGSSNHNHILLWLGQVLLGVQGPPTVTEFLDEFPQWISFFFPSLPVFFAKTDHIRRLCRFFSIHRYSEELTSLPFLECHHFAQLGQSLYNGRYFDWMDKRIIRNSSRFHSLWPMFTTNLQHWERTPS